MNKELINKKETHKSLFKLIINHLHYSTQIPRTGNPGDLIKANGKLAPKYV
jgi:hypothetical protein